MKKLFILILTFTLLVAINPIKAQTFGFEMKLDNFEQVSEYEFQFEAYVRKITGTDPLAIDVFQFQVQYDAAILNGGEFANGGLIFDNTNSDLVGDISDGVFTSIGNNRMQYVSGDAGNDGSVVTVLNDTWMMIGLFKVQLTKAGNFHNFGSAQQNFGFREDPSVVYTSLTRCEFTGSPGNYTKDGTSISAVSNRNLFPEHGVAMDLRQIAGYWFYGDGDWNEATNWNKELKKVYTEYDQEPPGANANAIINGNVTIPDGLDVSLLPDLVKSGNGGEVTVLTGAEPLYSIELVPNGTGATVTLYDAAYNVLPNPSTGIEAGTEFYFNTTGIPPSGTFINWTDQNSNVIGTTQFYGPYTMPAEDMVITANWSSKSSIITTKSKSILSSLTIVPGASLTVDKLFNDSSNGAEAIIVLSDATGTGYLIHNNEDVEATVQRYLSQGKYHYVSSPIVDAPFSMFQTEPVPVEPAYSDFFMWVEDYPEPDGPSWVNLNYPHYPATSTLTVGRGYAVADSENEFTKEFVGEVNVGDIVYNGTYTPKTDGPPYWNNRGYNLVGNPYPAALDADAFIDANDQTTYNIHGLYFWDEAPNYEGNRNDYAVYTEAGGTGTVSSTFGSGNVPTGYIAPGQGFMAQVISDPMNANANVDIMFNNSMRVTDETYFYKKSSDKDRIWLNVTGPEGDFNQILVAFMEGAEEGFDRTDAQKIRGNNKLAFYSILQDADFSIQGFPVLEATDTYEIPLGVFAGFSGQYTFDVQEIENFAPDTDITFEDRLAGQIINLRTTTQYTAHIADEGDIRDRFFLHINGPTSVPVIDSKLTKVYAVNNQIYIRHTGSSEILDVEVINTLGQTVISTPVNATETTITVPGRNLVYIVKVRTSEGIESHKLLIR